MPSKRDEIWLSSAFRRLEESGGKSFTLAFTRLSVEETVDVIRRLPTDLEELRFTACTAHGADISPYIPQNLQSLSIEIADPEHMSCLAIIVPKTVRDLSLSIKTNIPDEIIPDDNLEMLGNFVKNIPEKLEYLDIKFGRISIGEKNIDIITDKVAKKLPHLGALRIVSDYSGDCRTLTQIFDALDGSSEKYSQRLPSGERVRHKNIRKLFLSGMPLSDMPKVDALCALNGICPVDATISSLKAAGDLSKAVEAGHTALFCANTHAQGERFNAQDFLTPVPVMGRGAMPLRSFIAEQGQLAALVNPAYWVGNVVGLSSILQGIPEAHLQKSQVDARAVKIKATQLTLQQGRNSAKSPIR